MPGKLDLCSLFGPVSENIGMNSPDAKRLAIIEAESSRIAKTDSEIAVNLVQRPVSSGSTDIISNFYKQPKPANRSSVSNRRRKNVTSDQSRADDEARGHTNIQTSAAGTSSSSK